MVEVTQADMDLLDRIYGGLFKFKPKCEKLVLQEIAAHRIAAEKALLDRLRDLPERIAVMVSDRAILTMDIHEEDPRLSQICDEVRTALADALERGEHKGTDNAG